MFAHASSSAYVCLRCQHRVIQLRQKRLQTQITVLSRRWQSAAARAPQEDNDDDLHGNLDPTYPVESPRSGTRFRHWRPPPIAELGVNALGQPAEVLVLPNRRRKRQQEDAVDQDDAPNNDEPPTPNHPRILESIAQELKPVSNDEAVKNIDSLLHEIGQRGGELRSHQWTKTREALSKGFTVKQLSSYLNAALSAHHKVYQHQHSRVELAERIMGDVWKYTRTSQNKEVQVNKTFSNHYIKLFLVNQAALKQQGTIVPGVKISKAQKSKRLEISGPVEAVNKTVDQLRRLENKVKQVIVPFPEEMKMALHDLMSSKGSRRSKAEDCSALRNLLIKSKVVLKNDLKKSNHLRIYAFGDVNIETFLQRLMQWMEITTCAFVTSPLSEQQLDANCVVPAYSEGPYVRSTLLHRYIAPGLDSHRDPLPLDYLSRAVMDTLWLKIPGAPSSSLERFVQSISAHKIKPKPPRLSAELGLAIFQHDQGEKAASSALGLGDQQPEREALEYLLDENSKIDALDLATQLTNTKDATREGKTLRSAFSAYVPLLPQFLAQQRQLRPASTMELTNQSVARKEEPKSGFRLLYKSFDPQNPVLEIYASAGSGSTININKVTLSAGDMNQYFALPHLAVDLNFTRNYNATLFRDDMPLDSRYAPLMVQLAQHLGPKIKDDGYETENQTVSIGPLMDLNLSCLMSESSSGAQAQGLVATDTTTLKTSGKPKLLRQAVYVLTRAEWVDRAMYHLPIPGEKSNQFLLEHVMYSPLPHSPTQEPRQVLRVVEDKSSLDGDAMSKTIGTDEERFVAFVKAAYCSAVTLDDFVKHRTEVMVEENIRRQAEN
ncbi:hypothetical protein H2198_008698 [Neophaeococcomyces mojaviensis]|uniref:Uncharacterized protein n=1 Tax=Neophaeococcomyces mojaviensis TaxID=3383035 RepID=A0ACC2ZX57_9EURO|nr:hypothetical protein H2198_008698 [Knufia sp. JES_112]